MKIKAVIIDLDGTITTHDMSVVLAKAVGKAQETAQLNQLFWEGKLQGVAALVQQVNFLKGLTRQDIHTIVARNDYLRPGTKELFEYFTKNNIISIISSGSTLPLLELYKEKLGADYIVGSNPKMVGDMIGSISEEDYSGVDFKIRDAQAILESLDISAENVVAVGDSLSDKGMFAFAKVSIGVDVKPGVRELIDYEVSGSLLNALSILNSISHSD